MVNNLLAGDVLSTVLSVAVAILILLVMITIHEFGHYIAGKILHFGINEFSIGFGPALFKRKNKKTGEIFSLRLIPLGGYCAFAGEDDTEEEAQKKAPEEPFGDLCTTEKDAEQSDGGADGAYGEAKAASTEVSDGTQTSSPEREEDKKKNWFNRKKPWQRIIVLVAGAFMNYLLALILIMIEFGAYGEPMIGVWQTAATEDPAYAEYCLKDGDVFLTAEGNSVGIVTDVAKAVAGKKAGDLVNFRISRIVENGENGVVRERMDVQVMLREDVGEVSTSSTDAVWRALGVRYLSEEEAAELNAAEQEKPESERKSYVAGFQLARYSVRLEFGEVITHSFAYSGKIAGSIFQVIGELFTGKLGLDSFGGPVSTIVMTSQIVSQGFRYFLEIAAYIGVNLAVFNLLPIPALDGSKVIFTLIEWIRGKPVNRKVEAIIHTVGMVLLIGFAVLVDILQIF